MVGSGNIAIAATLNWVIKDGIGLFGGVLYTSMVSTHFDESPKYYRLRATVFLQIATLCELMAPFFPELFLPIASTSNIAKNISWLTLAGTRAKMHQSFCNRNNLGDVSAKAGSQGTAAGLFGTALGVLYSSYVGAGTTESILAFFPLAGISIYGVWKSNTLVVCTSLNPQRYEMLIYEYLKSKENRLVLTPNDIAEKENFFFKYNTPFERQLIVGSPITAVPTFTNGIRCFESFQSDSNYLIFNDKDKVYLWYAEKADSYHILKGYYKACLLRNGCDDKEDEKFSYFINQLKRIGWDINDIYLHEKYGRLKIQK